MSVYKGTTYSNLTALNATVVFTALAMAGTLTGNVDATTGYIAAIANAVNTTGKAAGTVVFDTTNSKIKVATGANANSTWVDADGTNAVTPS